MNHYVMMGDKLTGLVVSLEKATTAVNCLEETRAREISSRNIDKAVGDVRELLKLVKEWGDEPDAAYVVPYNQPPQLVLHDMQIWEVRESEGQIYLFDGHFNRSGVNIEEDTFRLTLERLELTTLFSQRLQKLYDGKSIGVILNGKGIREHVLGIWIKLMANIESEGARTLYTDEFNAFLYSIEQQTALTLSIQVAGVSLFDQQN